MSDPKQYMFVANRDITIVSTQGYSLSFKKGEPLHVPRAMHAEVMEKGVLPVDQADAEAVTAAQEPKVLIEPEDAEERKDKIREVVVAMAKRNSPKDFSAGGVPLATAVSLALGWKADPKEVRAVWAEVKPTLE